MKIFFARVIDSVLLFCLIYGHSQEINSAESFALVVIASMAVLMAFGSLVMGDDLALSLADKSSTIKAFSYIVGALYVVALVMSDHPYWAAAYFISFSWIYVAAHSKLKDMSK